MKEIIDIPDEIYNMVMNTGTFGKYRFNTTKAIRDGKPLTECEAEDCVKRSDIKQMLTDIEEAVYMGDGYDYDTWRDRLDELPPVYPKSEEFKWCHDCKEYDQEQHCCHRFSKVIRESLTEHTDAVIKDIKAELHKASTEAFNYPNWEYAKGLDKAIDIIDSHINRKEQE